ncbi:MAG: hypothetical protein NTU72_05730 [Fimbriimonadales bacterium]|jgi:hypothetical protein|nr:hypothetical protein [Fimbriimonadales bacterium]
MKIKLLLLCVFAVFAIGCGNDAPVSQATTKNSSGEMEGNAPNFVMVPSQNDPNAPASK